MSNSSQSPVSKNVQQTILWLSTIASLVFFGWFWLLFLPVNILGKMTPFFQWLGEFLPSPVMTVVFFLLLALIYFGGLFVFTRLYYLAAKKILNRSVPAFAAFAVIAILLGILLWPVPCDTHQSFFDIPDKQCDCAGWTFEFYPPFVMDGSSTDFCMGWEIPVLNRP
ncbi:MAG: hypothetical protein AUJ21_04180 [Anaerolineae bacterium CG1_02_58_13]|nr:MAG: hypothetical protein AUJ21_04180 [Anaerolineae bacterium CG1_02_58_13]